VICRDAAGWSGVQRFGGVRQGAGLPRRRGGPPWPASVRARSSGQTQPYRPLRRFPLAALRGPRNTAVSLPPHFSPIIYPLTARSRPSGGSSRSCNPLAPSMIIDFAMTETFTGAPGAIGIGCLRGRRSHGNATRGGAGRGNPHVRFDEGEGGQRSLACASQPVASSLLYWGRI
jgi:hypothetical protein